MKYKLIASSLSLLSAGSALAGMGIVVPAYFYPAGSGLAYWQQMTAAASKVPVIAIADPANGPGTFVDSNYVAAIAAFRAAGGKIFGYVDTAYGARSLSAVQGDMAAWNSMYSIDGIFLDQYDNSASTASLSLAQSVYSAAHSVKSSWQVMANPGTNIDSSYVTTPTADQFMDFESPSSAYASFVPDAWAASHPGTAANIVYQVSTAAAMTSTVALANSRHAGWVYVSDLNVNVYDTLPSYWDQEVAAVQAVPEPSAFLGLGLGAVLLGLKSKRPRMQ